MVEALSRHAAVTALCRVNALKPISGYFSSGLVVLFNPTIGNEADLFSNPQHLDSGTATVLGKGPTMSRKRLPRTGVTPALFCRMTLSILGRVPRSKVSDDSSSARVLVLDGVPAQELVYALHL